MLPLSTDLGGNGSTSGLAAPCAGLEQYTASRPPINAAVSSAFLAAYVLLMVVWFLSIGWFWKERHTSRLGVLRPFGGSVIMCLSHMMLATCTALNLAVPNLPCWLFILTITAGIGGITSCFITRIVIYISRSQFAKLARGARQITSSEDDDNGNNTSTVASSISGGESKTAATHPKTADSTKDPYTMGRGIVPRVADYFQHVLLLSGCRSIDQITPSSVARAKSDIYIIAFNISLPLTFGFVLLMGGFPVYAHCAGCTMFLEVITVLAVAVAMQAVVCVRLAYIVWQAEYNDSQGFFRETKLNFLVCVPVCILAVLLVWLDPGEVNFQRQFDYEWLVCVALALSWYVAVGEEMLAVWRFKTRMEFATNNSSRIGGGGGGGGSSITIAGIHANFAHQPFNINVLESLSEEDERDFRAFTQRQFCVEHLNFCQDAAMFSKYFGQKSASWRTSKARRLIDMYITPGSFMEINISCRCRNALLAEFRDNPNKVTNAALFQNSVDEVMRSVLVGVWMDFCSTREAAVAAAAARSGLAARALRRTTVLISSLV